MKTLNDLSIGDILYRVRAGLIDITETKVNSEITKKTDGIIRVYHEGNGLESNSKNSCFVFKTSYNADYYFINKTEAIRFSKSQLIKELNKKILEARKAIKDVKKFRELHFDKLNLTHTDRHILQLEKELN